MLIAKATTWQSTNHAQNTGNSKSDPSIYVSMNSTLNILQANLGKMSGAQDALYNDQELWEFDLILIQEPHYCDFNSNTHITGIGANFEVTKPKDNTSGNQDSRIRSCIWAHRNNEYIQLPTNDNDSTIIILQRANRNILVASVYIQKESGAVFESSKTAFIHFTRSTSEWRDSNMPLRFKQDIINPSQSFKILGVIMDQELRYKEHVAGKADKAFKAALALKRLQGLRPSSMRQSFSATVAPVMGYASPIWNLAISDKTLAKLESPESRSTSDHRRI